MGVMPDGLECPPLPAAAAHIWGWFCELSRCPGGIGYVEIAAWAQLTGTRPSQFEVECLMRLSAAMSNPINALPGTAHG